MITGVPLEGSVWISGSDQNVAGSNTIVGGVSRTHDPQLFQGLSDLAF